MSNMQPMSLAQFLQQVSLNHYNEVHKIDLNRLSSYLPDFPELVYDGRTKLVYRWNGEPDEELGEEGLEGWVKEVNKGLLSLGVENLKLDVEEVYSRDDFFGGSPDFIDVLIEFQ